MILNFHRICAILLVKDASGYNDIFTKVFKKLSLSVGESNDMVDSQYEKPKSLLKRKLAVRFSYLDAAKQAGFIEATEIQQCKLRRCVDGTTARPVR